VRDEDDNGSGKDPEDSLVSSRGSEDLLPPTPKIDLRDPHAVRRELAAVYRDCRAGRLETAEGTRLGYLLSLLLRAFETTDQEERIEALERTLSERKRLNGNGSNR
jgi:hypothetical protein